MDEIINNTALKLPREKVAILPTQLDGAAATIGGATLVLEKVFKGTNL
jgi:hypothetical protein